MSWLESFLLGFVETCDLSTWASHVNVELWNSDLAYPHLGHATLAARKLNLNALAGEVENGNGTITTKAIRETSRLALYGTELANPVSVLHKLQVRFWIWHRMSFTRTLAAVFFFTVTNLIVPFARGFARCLMGLSVHISCLRNLRQYKCCSEGWALLWLAETSQTASLSLSLSLPHGLQCVCPNTALLLLSSTLLGRRKPAWCTPFVTYSTLPGASKPAHGIIPWTSWLHFCSKLASEQVTSECIPHASSRAKTVCYSNQFGLPLGMNQLGLHMMHLVCSIWKEDILNSKQPLNWSCFRSKLWRILRCRITRDWTISVDLLASNVATIEWLASRPSGTLSFQC